MLNRSASLAMSTSVLKALPGKLDIERHSPSILYFYCDFLRGVKRLIHLLLCAVIIFFNSPLLPTKRYLGLSKMLSLSLVPRVPIAVL